MINCYCENIDSSSSSRYQKENKQKIQPIQRQSSRGGRCEEGWGRLLHAFYIISSFKIVEELIKRGGLLIFIVFL